MEIENRTILTAFVALLGTMTIFTGNVEAQSQSFPTKPMRIVVGFAPGGSADVLARLVGQKVAGMLSQPVIVENRPGASGAIASERVAASQPDGYTLLMGTGADTIIPVLRVKLPYNLERDLSPVSLVAVGPYVLTLNPSVPARNIKELIEIARAQPGKISFGSAGIGSTTHLAGALFGEMAKVKLLHVPYKGGSASAGATASGQVTMSFAGIAGTVPLVAAGKIKALAVSTVQRSALMPSVPTLDEAGLSGYERLAWYGVLVPTNVHKNIIRILNEAITKALTTSEIKQALSNQGFEPQSSTPEKFAALIKAELGQNARLAKAVGLKAE